MMATSIMANMLTYYLEQVLQVKEMFATEIERKTFDVQSFVAPVVSLMEWDQMPSC